MTPDLGLEGKVAIVTGAGSRSAEVGNGRAAAVLLARCGAKVAVVDISLESAELTCQMILDEGGDAASFVSDVSDNESCLRVVEEVRQVLGEPYVLVNNVGISGPAGTAVDVDLDEWDRCMKVNVKSVVMMCKHVVPLMSSAGGGTIINIGSTGGLSGGSAIVYATSKGAIVNLTKTLAAHHGPEGIRVNCVAPGMVYTPMVASRGMTPEMREVRRMRSLLKSEGTGWDVGAAVVFLASDLSRWITGVILPVDGGYLSALPYPTPPREWG